MYIQIKSIFNYYIFYSRIRNDPRLAWNSTEWNTDVLMLSLKKIWSPDTIVMNSASGDGYLKINADYSYAPVYYDGTVYFATYQIGLQTRYWKFLFFTMALVKYFWNFITICLLYFSRTKLKCLRFKVKKI